MVTAPDGPGPSGDSTLPLCQRACSQVIPGCTRVDCVTGCQQILGDPRCGALARPLIECQARTSPDDYVCIGSDTALKESACTQETRAWVHCSVGTGTGGAGPPKR
jgi:hypothetical protein